MALRRFADPGAVVEYLTTERKNKDATDAVYRSLVTLAQAETSERVWPTLIWLGLWPGLEAVLAHNVRFWSSRHDELLSELVVHLLRSVRRLRLDGVTRVAATLVWNVEREVRRTSLREVRRQARRVSLDDLDPDLLKAPDDTCPADRLARVRRFLDHALGANAELVFRVIALGESQLAVSRRLGLSESATNKRFQRALKRLLTMTAPPCPDSPDQVACTQKRRKQP